MTRPLSVVFRDRRDLGGPRLYGGGGGRAPGLDGFDVVVDFRDLEAALDRSLAPLQGKLLSDLGLDGPLALARRLLADLAPFVPSPRLPQGARADGWARTAAGGAG